MNLDKINQGAKDQTFQALFLQLLDGDIENIHQLDFSVFEDVQRKFCEHVEQALNNLKPIDINDKIPMSGLKGVYFCVGYKALTLNIGGSLYFQEEDWAANAEFSPENEHEIGGALDEVYSLLDVEILSSELMEKIIYGFIVAALLHSLPKMRLPVFFKNTGFVTGYSSGDELILGEFRNGIFFKKIKCIEDGDYGTPSSVAETPYKAIEQRGPLWDYLHHNYQQLMKENDLFDAFILLGEKEAEKISLQYKQDILINRCQICNFIKKTPKARLCLGCGDFNE